MKSSSEATRLAGGRAMKRGRDAAQEHEGGPAPECHGGPTPERSGGPAPDCVGGDAPELTIGDVAARFGLATHVLRHWESMGLLVPATRVNGRRRYRKEQLLRVGMILRGKEAGFSLDQMREVLTAANSTARRALLERHRADLERRIVLAQSQKELVDHALECPAEDFIDCPDFQRVAYSLAERVPVGSAGEEDIR